MFTSTVSSYVRQFTTVVIFSIAGIGLIVALPVRAQTESPRTVSFDLEKKFSGPYPSGYTADQFTFSVSGYSTPVTLTAYSADSANGAILLPVGTYQLSEVGPAGFVESEWRVQWSGAGCANATANTTTITVTESDIGKVNFGCRADNQWRHGNLAVQKLVIGTSTTPENFSFTITEGDRLRFEGAFEADGENEVTIGAGQYSVTENPSPEYSASYSADCTGIMDHGESKTCTITNTYSGGNGTTSVPGRIIIEKQTIPDSSSARFTFDPSWSDINIVLGDGEQSTSSDLQPGVYQVSELPLAGWTQTSAVCSDGSSLAAITVDAGESVTCVVTNTVTDGGGGSDRTYRVFGYVWHDRNENTVWDVTQPNPADEESDLDGWEVRISNGSTTYATTTDVLGYYYFEVPAGTWKLTEVVQSLWKLTFPFSNEHTVIVVDDSVAAAATREENKTILHRLFSYILNPVYAQTTRTYGPYNFGNVQSGSGGGGSNGGGRSGGGRSNRSLSVVSPEPLVLGAATNEIPLGAPNTGGGGTSPVFVFSVSLPPAMVPSWRYSNRRK